MRRFATVAITSGALIAGLTAAISPAHAATPAAAAAAAPGKDVTQTTTGTLTAKVAVSKANDGKAHATACRWYQRVQGRQIRVSGKWRWAYALTSRLTWCYNGKQVTSARLNYKAYTRNKYVYQLKGWTVRKMIPSSKTPWWVEGRAGFRVLWTPGKNRYYYPTIHIRGYGNGAYKWWAHS